MALFRLLFFWQLCFCFPCPSLSRRRSAPVFTLLGSAALPPADPLLAGAREMKRQSRGAPAVCLGSWAPRKC